MRPIYQTCSICNVWAPWLHKNFLQSSRTNDLKQINRLVSMWVSPPFKLGLLDFLLLLMDPPPPPPRLPISPCPLQFVSFRKNLQLEYGINIFTKHEVGALAFQLNWRNPDGCIKINLGRHPCRTLFVSILLQPWLANSHIISTLKPNYSMMRLVCFSSL